MSDNSLPQHVRAASTSPRRAPTPHDPRASATEDASTNAGPCDDAQSLALAEAVEDAVESSFVPEIKPETRARFTTESETAPRRPIHPAAELRGTIYETGAALLASVIAEARSRGDDQAFTQMIRFALDFRRLWSGAELADLFITPYSTLAKWRAGEATPRPVIRRVVIEDLQDALKMAFPDGPPPASDPAIFVGAADLAAAARAELLRVLRERVDEPREALSDADFSANLRAAIDFGALTDIDAFAEAIEFSPSTLSRWGAGDHLPKPLVRKGVVAALRDFMDGDAAVAPVAS